MSFIGRAGFALKSLYQHPYNKKRPLFAFYRFLRRQADKRLWRRPAIHRFWGDRRAICYPDSEQTMWLEYHYIMDWEEFSLIRDTLKSDSIVFDVGSNIGTYMLWMSRFVDRRGRIVCFEPDPGNFSRCNDLVRLNRLEGYVRVEPLALSDKQGELFFSQGTDRTNHLVPEGKTEPGAIRVRVTTLDDYCQTHGIEKIDYLKLDVEGAELFVLSGARKLLEGGKLPLIQFELNTEVKKYGIEGGTLIEFFGKYGYRICRYDVSRKEFLVCSPENFRENMFAVLKAP